MQTNKWKARVGLALPLFAALGIQAAAPLGSVSGTVVYSRAGSPDGTIWFAAGDGSADIQVTTGEWPRISADGRYLLFHRGNSTYSRADVWVRELATGAETRVFANNDYVVAYDWTRDGAQIIFDYSCDIRRMNRDGSAVTTIVPVSDCYDDAPTVNPVDGRLVFHNIHTGLWIANADGSARGKIPNTTGGAAPELYPVWSPDGGRVAFQTGATYAVIKTDGSGRTDLLAAAGITLTHPQPDAPAAWSSDGNWLVLGANVDGVNGLYAVATDGTGVLRRLATAPGDDITFVGDVSTNLPLTGTASLSLSLAALPSPAAVGQAFQLISTVRNGGPAPATNTVVTNLLPAGVRLVSATASRGTAATAAGQVIANLGNLAPGESATVTATLVPTNAAFLLSTASATHASRSFAGSRVATNTTLAVAGTVGAIARPGERDAYTFHLAASGRYYFDALFGESSMRWSLAGPGGTLVDRRYFQYSDGASIGDPYVVLALIPGDYTLTIFADGDATPAYAFAFLNLAEAPLLTLGSPVGAELIPATRTLAWQFPAAAGDRITLDVLGRTNLNYVSWRLVDPLGRVVFQNSFTDSGPLTLTGAGNYTLLVEGYYSNPGAGTCALNVVALGNTPPSPPTGAPLVLGQATTGNLAANTTNGYVFTLANAATLAFDSLTNRWDLNWSITGPYGLATAVRNFRDSDGDRGNPLLPLPAGVYALQVTGYNGAEGPYGFRLLDLAAAVPISRDKPVVGHLDPANATDAYTFTAPAGTQLFFDTPATARWNCYWRLVDPYGGVVFATSLNAVQGPLTLTIPGAYTLLIEGDAFETGAMDYSFQIVTVTDGAQALTLGASVNGAVSQPGQVQRHTFTLTATNQLYFDSLTNAADVRWSLDGPAGRIVDHRDFRSSDGDRGYSAFGLVPGDYTLTVDGIGDKTAPYAFRLVDLANAAPVSLNTQINGTLNPANRTDAYRFNLAGSTRLFFDSATTARWNCFWRLLDPYGGVVFAQSQNSDQGPLVLATPGVYTLLIEGDVYETGAMDYSFQIVTVTDGTQVLTLGATVNGVVTQPGQVQRHTFKLTATNQLYFDSRTNAADLRWSLEGPAGRMVDHRDFRSSDGDRGYSAFWLGPGDYILTVDGVGDKTGPYSFRFFDLATASPVPLNAQVDGSLDPANRTDAYRFTVAGTTRLFFDSATTARWNTFWRLLDPYGGVVFAQSQNSDQGPLVLTAPGVYTLLIEGDVYETGAQNYGFRIVAVTDGQQALTLGATATGAISQPGQVQRYAFSLATTTRLYFDSLTNNADLFWSLDGPPGRLVDRRGFISSDGYRGLSLFTLPAGNYTVVVDANGDKTGPYSFRWLNLANAIAFTTDQTIAGTLNPARSTDLYRFTAAAGDRITFDSLSGAGPNTMWRLIDPYSQVLFAQSMNTDQGPLTLIAAGAYTLLIEGDVYESSASPYSFKLLPQGNTPPTPFTGTPLTLGVTINGNAPTNTTTNSYTFALGGATTFVFDVLSAPGNFVWSLRGPQGLVVDRLSFYVSDYHGSQVPIWTPPAGAYQLSVTGDNGPFAFRLLDVATATPYTPGTLFTGTNTPANATTLLRFTASAGQPFYFAGGSHTGFTRNPWIVIYTPLGVQLDTMPTDANKAVTTPLAGTYTLAITTAPEDDAATGTYSFNLAPVNNSTNTLALGATINGVIDSPGQARFYTFSLAKPARLAFDALTNANTRVSLRGPDGLHYDRAYVPYVDYSATPFVDVPAGDFLLTIDADGPTTTPFSFRLLDFASAIPIALGGEVAGTNTPAAATSLFSFAGRAGDELYYLGRSRAGFVNYQPSTVVFAPSGQRVFSVGVENPYGPFTLPETGIYVAYVGTPPFETGATGSFGFVLVPVADGTNALVLGATVNSAIATPGQQQFFTFSLPGPKRLHFDTLSGQASLSWSLSGPQGVVVNNANAYYSDTFSQTPWLDLPGGNYLLSFNMSGPATNAFAFRLLDFATATPLTPGQPVTATVTPGNGTTLLRFEAAAGDVFYLDARGTAGFTQPVSLVLVTPLGQRLFSNYGSQDVDDFTVPQTGTYTLLVEGRPEDAAPSGSFSFTLVPQPPQPPVALFNALTAPDLIVAQVTPTPSSGLLTGQSVGVGWQVRNTGNAPAASSFTDRVTIRNPANGHLLANRVLFDDAAVNGPLAPGASRSRSLTVRLPDGPDAAGTLEVAVTTDALNNVPEQNGDGTGEANNAGTASLSVLLAPYPDLRVVSLSANPPGNWTPGSTVAVTWADTNAGPAAAAGPWTDSLAVRNLTNGRLLASASTNDTAGPLNSGGTRTRSLQFTLPNDANAYGQIAIAVTTDSANEVFEFLSGLDAEANNTTTIAVLNQAPGLALSLSTNRVAEGASLTATVSRQPLGPQPLTVLLTTSDNTRLAAPATVTIPANTAAISFLVTAIDDPFIEGTNTYTLTATAAGFNQAAAAVTIEEHDFPTVTLTLAAHTISEADGPNATSGTVTRSPVTAHPVLVALTSGNPDAARVPAFVTIPANQASASFPVAAIRDGIVTGTRAVALGGFILDDFTRQPLLAIVPDALSVTDADGPALFLRLAAALVREGLDPATTATVSRNTPTTTALSVTLASSDPGTATVPSAVTIPAGSASANFPVASIFDASKAGNRAATLTASAPGFTAGSATLVVTDINLPDLVVTRISFVTNGVTGGSLPVTFRVENRGLTPATNAFAQRLFLATDNVGANSVVVGQVDFPGPLPVGQFVEQTVNVHLPDAPGKYWLVVVADANNSVVEALEDNNTLVSTTAVAVEAGYTATVQAGISTGLSGQPVPLSGQATLLGNANPAAFVPVTIHLEVRGIRRTLGAVTDAAGRFSAIFHPLPGEAGHYHLAAAYPGLPMPPAQSEFILLGVRTAPMGVVSLVEKGSLSVTTTVANLSDMPLTGLSVQVVTNHPSLSVNASLNTNALAGNDQATLTLTITAVNTSAIQSGVVLRVTSAEGATDTLVITVRQELLTPRLVATPNSLNGGMVRGRQSTTTLTVANNGGLDTGPLELLAPNLSWLSITAPVQIDSLPPGSNAVVTVLLTPPADLPLGEYNGTLILRSAKAGLSVPYAFRAVSDQKGDLSIVAEDEYTYFAAGNPHVTNALVVLSDALSGRPVATNRTDAVGVALFNGIAEAVYVVDLAAEGHTPNRGTVTVAAGTLTSKTVFLTRETVHYTFTVEPTTVEDRYTLTVESTFETQVPLPVVTIDPPSVDLSQYPGTEFQFQITVANHGLIAAQHVRLRIPSTDRLQLTPLITDLGTLAANTSLTIPVLVKRLPAHATTLAAQDAKVRLQDAASGQCSVNAGMLWDYLCGPNVVNKDTAFYVFDSTGCDLVDLYSQVYELVPEDPSGTPGGGPVITSDEYFDYLKQLNPVTDFEPPPGYKFRCRDTRPANFVVGGRVLPARLTKASARPASAEPGPNEVCAKVKLQLNQRAVLTRDAFKATLELDNDTTNSLQNVLVNLEIKGADGQLVNTLFGVRPPEVSGFHAVDGSGALPDKTLGRATWILVPTLDAAPTNGFSLYLVGGTLSYQQNGAQITIPLAPAPIQVFPQPELVVRYFHDRDVFADDPFTPEIEPSLPYSLAAQVLNVGYGAARDLRLSGGKPQIIENQKGLLIDFQTVGTQLERDPITPALDVNFGGIAPGTNKIARWLFLSTLQGSFTNFAASFEQTDSFGAKRSSLIRRVEIHELSHIVDADRTFADGRPDFLVNEDNDSNHLPDTLYLSDGGTGAVSAVTSAGFGGILSSTNLRVTVTVTAPAGWVYLRLPNPGDPATFTLARVQRQDGTEISLGTNAWTSDRLFRGSDLRPIRTNLLHILDYNSGGNYTLVYQPVAPTSTDTTPPVSSVTPLPANSAPNFTVAWNGADSASGLAFYDIYVSVNGGPFTKWLDHTSLGGAVYQGQSGAKYGFYSRATDQAGNTEAAPAAAQAQTTVSVVNTPPTISLGSTRTLSQGDTLNLAAQVQDSDTPAQVFTFELLAGAPPAVLLNPNTGTLTWHTSVTDGPSTNILRVRVTDSGVPPLSATGAVTVIITAVNTPPSLAPIPNQRTKEGVRLVVAANATDLDLPPQHLSFSLAPGAPLGAAIDPVTGVFSWQPTFLQGPSTNQVSVIVTDDGVPPLSASRDFTVVVRKASAEITLTAGWTNVLAGAAASVPLTIEADTDLIDLGVTLEAPAARLGQWSLGVSSADVVSVTFSPVDADHLQLHFTLSGAAVSASRMLAALNFTSVTNAHSAIVRLGLSGLTGRSSAHVYERTLPVDGFVIVIAGEPALLAFSQPQPELVVFGKPGATYQLQFSDGLTPAPVWKPLGPVTLTTTFQVQPLPTDHPLRFFRALVAP